ncbi:E3 ubiquitin-protein ligase ubr1, variant 2 [Dermatophagoides farinae]|uniref:E3 ubiquitin-protein ligase n=1 Tax=Dermatophagoides farinae TaxID=6954 RepID=A0A922IDN2_DERFA|nr:E3 ubiquitin-protein ligase ubr1, variant 2 [Dermatophagoides farinae]
MDNFHLEENKHPQQQQQQSERKLKTSIELSDILKYAKCIDNNLHSDNGESFIDLIEEQWKRIVPELFRPQISTSPQSFDEQRVYEELIKPLECFITGVEQSHELLDKLKNISKPPQLCGRVFKLGEPTYSCRDCSSDPTCVLCVDCFKHSVHRQHRYRISPSSSGYCDCGDPEAWKCDAICSLHAAKRTTDSDLSAILSLMTEQEFNNILIRLRIVIHYVLDYIYLLLKWNQTDLPKRLQTTKRVEKPEVNRYASVLYNDETHTYEHVIYALTKSIKCDNKKATDYANTVDREGRCVIFIGTQERCDTVKSIISDTNRKNEEKVLEVKVLSTHLVAHQTFVTRLMVWIMEMLPICKQFRLVLADYLYQPGHHFQRFNDFQEQSSSMANLSLLEKIMHSDTWFWKSIRILWHKMFMSGLLLDLKPKKQFARLFTQHYPHLLEDFVKDDHEEHVSILSLSVQIYTVPSIARMLIEEENAITILINTFLELNFSYHQQGRFNFSTTPNTPPFRRSYRALRDTHYLLTPKIADLFEWSTDRIRNHFLEGAEAFAKLLKRTQQMETMIRQVVQHIEYEPGRDMSTKFEFILAPLIKSFIEWSITDSQIYLNVFNTGLRLAKDSFDYYANGGDKQNENPVTNSRCTTVRRHYAFRSAMVWDYNVGRKEMSIHTPLSRFLAGLMLHLPEFPDLWNEYNDYSSDDDCGRCRRLTPYRLNAESTMELALRTQVLLGQFRAGMWRRNGYSFINQIHFYLSPSLRATTYDLDILNLQIGAAMLDPNEFMIHVMCKYSVNVILDDREYSPSKRNDDATRHQITLLEEFLRLIYTILVERYTVKLGSVNDDDCCKNEIIQWLCKESMSNSELFAHLNQDYCEKNIEDLILEVAEFRRSLSTSNTAGRYVLKDVYRERFNPFFYHYTRQDQSAAYETQIRIKRDRKEKHLCCPPPPLPDFSEPFRTINQILLCDVTLTLLKCLLEKTIDLKDIYFSDFQFQQCLYLIGIALNEELKYPDRFKFSQRAIDFNIVSLLEQCSTRHILTRVEMHQGLYDWCMDRFKQVMLLHSSSTSSSSSISTDEPQQQLIEQNRNSTTFGHHQEQERSRRRKMAAARQERILQLMQQQQRSFLKENEKYFKENPVSIDNNNSSKNKDVSMTDMTGENDSGELGVAFGARRTTYNNRIMNSDDVFTCILCLESQDVNTNNGRYLLLAGFIQQSTVLSKNRSMPTWKDTENINCMLTRSDHNFCPFINTCTHYMHNDCFEKYFETTMLNERRRSAHRYPRVTYDLHKREFLCPLCETLSNVTIPIMPSLAQPVKPATIAAEMTIDQWLNAMLVILQSCNSIWINDVNDLSKVPGFSKGFSQLIASLTDDSLKQTMQSFKQEYDLNRQPIIDVDAVESQRDIRGEIVGNFYKTINEKTICPDDALTSGLDAPHDLIQCLNWSISYTLQVMERSMRLDERKRLSMDQMVDTRQYQCLKALIKMARVQSNFMHTLNQRRVFLYLMNYLLVTTVYQSSPYHLLDVDAFTLLISLMITSPSFFVDDSPNNQSNRLFWVHHQDDRSKHQKNFIMPIGNNFERNIIELMLTFHIVQIVLTNDNLVDSTPIDEPMDVDGNECTSSSSSQLKSDDDDSKSNSPNNSPLLVASFCKDILIAAGHKFSEDELMANASQIEAFIKQRTLPFLRSSALFAYFLTEIRWPERLWNQSKDKNIATTIEYDLLCRYLAIERDLGLLLQSINLRHLCLIWTRHQKLSTLFEQPTAGTVRTCLSSSNLYLRQPHEINRLVKLPYDFSDLINSVVNFTCPNSNGGESRYPTMCLICGEILCSQNYCCQHRVGKESVGACTYHSQQCSASMGIFLRIRDNKILLLTSRSRGCYLASPYVDKFGETDSGLCRGHPMFLSEPAYEQLYKIWFRHGIPEQIVHLMETSNSLPSINWNMM